MDEFSEIDLATARPTTLPARSNDEFVVKKYFYIQVIHDAFIVVGLHHYEHSQIDSSFTQSRRFGRKRAQLFHVQNHARIGLRKPMNDGWKDCGRDRLLAADPHLSNRRIGQE